MRGPSSTKKTTSTLALMVALPLVLACQPGDQGQQGMEEGPAEQEEATGATATSQLTALGDSRVSGDVQFTRSDGTLTVEVVAQMGSPGDYPSHIHEGTCQEPGGVAVPLNAGTAEEPGIAEASTDVDAAQLEAGGSYVVLVHTQQGAPAACAEVPPSVLR